MDGKAYYRAVRGHVLAYDALWRIRWRLFQDWLIEKGNKTLDEMDKVAKPVLEVFQSKDRRNRELVRSSVENIEKFIEENMTLLLKEFD